MEKFLFAIALCVSFSVKAKDYRLEEVKLCKDQNSIQNMFFSFCDLNDNLVNGTIKAYYDSGNLKTRDVYTFTGSKFKGESYSLLLGGFDEPWITITGSFTVDGDKATLTEENTGLNVKIEITTDDKWKSFTDKSGNVYKKKGL